MLLEELRYTGSKLRIFTAAEKSAIKVMDVDSTGWQKILLRIVTERNEMKTKGEL